MHAGGAHTYIGIVLVRHDVLSSSLFFTSGLAPIRNSHTVRSNKNEIELTLYPNGGNRNPVNRNGKKEDDTLWLMIP